MNNAWQLKIQDVIYLKGINSMDYTVYFQKKNGEPTQLYESWNTVSDKTTNKSDKNQIAMVHTTTDPNNNN